MIFANYLESSSNNTSTFPYEANLEGALMCVYENECNYNALMKAVGISELKYYNETGKDLFIENSTAFDNFIDKAKEFFKAAASKIKEIFNKFKIFILSVITSNDKLLSKYSEQLKAIENTPIEYEGYPFIGLERCDKTIFKLLDQLDEDNINKLTDGKSENISIDDIRGDILDTNSITSSEFSRAARDKMYGKRMTIRSTVKAELHFIENLKDDLKDVNKIQDKALNTIASYIKSLDTLKKNSKDRQYRSEIGVSINAAKQFTQCTNVLFGVIMAAYKDRNLQAKKNVFTALKTYGNITINVDNDTARLQNKSNESTVLHGIMLNY